jgi:hypothetical protein
MNVLLPKPISCFNKLSTNEKSHDFNIPPFALSLSKGKRSVWATAPEDVAFRVPTKKKGRDQGGLHFIKTRGTVENKNGGCL